jgi:hypothetical protein
MSFNLSASPSTDDIKVGYIDPTLGYVSGVTICEANNYAKDNPGTTFIYVNGNNNIQYLNINEVNNLTPDTLVSTADTCGGIQNYVPCGTPKIQFFGGGGIGAVGNPVIGIDGSLLAVDVVYGGNGYQYPPIVVANDPCQIGSGTVLTAVLGETADQVEVYSGEEDFEEYEICEPTDVGYGSIYGINGEELGEWDPNAYASDGQDPIQKEIEAFQNAIQSPFWTTRQYQPDRIIVLGEQYTTQETTEVTDSRWGEFMNLYAVSPVKSSDTVGTDEAGKVFQIEWEHNFPISGEYIFRGVCDNIGQVYIDDSLVGNLKSFTDNPSPLQKTIQEGNHIIRVDLTNVPTIETKTTTTTTASLKAKFIQKGSSYYLKVDGTGSAEITFVMDVNDSTIIAGLAAKEVRIPSDSGKVKFIRTEYALGGVLGLSAPTEETIKESGTFSGGKQYGPIEIIGADPAARGPIPIKGESNKLALRDADGDDENIKITIEKIKGGESATEVGQVISPKSFNENPMGVSMIIEAPTPSVPQEQLPIVEGECPPNPIWTTRFPNSTELWYPVRNELWEDFFNRYAISPVPPLNTPGSDGSGIVHKNSWEIDIPYEGYYAFQVQRDNTARVYVDGIIAFDVTTSGDSKWIKNGLINKVKTQKVFITKGRHTISIELENTSQDTSSIIDSKVFSTQDWRTSSTSSPSNIKAYFVQKGSSYYLQVDGTGSAEITFVMDVNDASYIAGLAAKEVRIPSDSGKVKFIRTEYGLGGVLGLSAPTEETIKESGTFSGGKQYGPIEIIGADPAARGPIPIKGNSNKFALRDADGDDENIKITIEKIKNTGTSTVPGNSQSPTKDGVSYSGPYLTRYTDKSWSKFMNDFSVAPDPVNEVGTVKLTWSNVNFPLDGTYKFNFQADNIATLTIGGVKIYTTSDFIGEKVQYTFNITAGKYDIVIELQNIKGNGNNDNNPRGVALFISKDIILTESNKTSWIENPMGISAILIPPPCAKRIGGKGVVQEVIVNDSGNGYLPPLPQGPGYPATLVLDKVIVENPGINYSCGEDQLQIVPDNGAVISYSCDSFGKIKDVKVENSGIGFNVYPSITIPSETGVNASFRPVFRVIRDPLLPPDKLIQVTDLVGLKQTGYVDGRAYYGAVYYDQGIPYAGYYKTAGTQVRVYATLQESITAKVTTPSSAIQRSGTDIRSNDPRLNIPGTPQSTTEQ